MLITHSPQAIHHFVQQQKKTHFMVLKYVGKQIEVLPDSSQTLLLYDKGVQKRLIFMHKVASFDNKSTRYND